MKGEVGEKERRGRGETVRQRGARREKGGKERW